MKFATDCKQNGKNIEGQIYWAPTFKPEMF